MANIQPGSVASSTFSFTDSVANSFDDDMDVFDSIPSDHSDTPTSPNSTLAQSPRTIHVPVVHCVSVVR